MGTCPPMSRWAMVLLALVLALAATAASGCDVPPGWTFRASESQLYNTMASYTVPIDEFDTQALADDCHSQPGCSAVFIMPELPAYGTMYTEYRVELKEYSESEWVSVDPPAGTSGEDLCLGTMVDDNTEVLPPNAEAPPSEGGCQVPTGWTYQHRRMHQGSTLAALTIPADMLNTETLAAECLATDGCVMVAIMPLLAMGTTIFEEYSISFQGQCDDEWIDVWLDSSVAEDLADVCMGTMVLDGAHEPPSAAPTPGQQATPASSPGPKPAPIQQSCATPDGWTYRNARMQQGGDLKGTTIPLADLDTQALADECLAMEDCNAIYIIPLLPAGGTMYTQYRVVFKTQTDAAWLWVDPPRRGSLGGLCLGTFLYGDSPPESPMPAPSPSPSATRTPSPANSAVCRVPDGWTYVAGRTQSSGTILMKSVPLGELDTQALADECLTIEGCTAVFLVPALPAGGTAYTDYRVEFKSASDASWVWVDPPLRGSLNGLCLGTFVNNGTTSPAPASGPSRPAPKASPAPASTPSPSGTGCGWVPPGWTFAPATGYPGPFLLNLTVPVPDLDLRALAANCSATPGCTALLLLPVANAGTSNVTRYKVCLRGAANSTEPLDFWQLRWWPTPCSGTFTKTGNSTGPTTSPAPVPARVPKPSSSPSTSPSRSPTPTPTPAPGYSTPTPARAPATTPSPSPSSSPARGSCGWVPPGWTFAPATGYPGPFLLNLTVPVPDLDLRALAANCSATPGCTALLLLPVANAGTSNVTRYKVCLRGAANSTEPLDFWQLRWWPTPCSGTFTRNGNGTAPAARPAPSTSPNSNSTPTPRQGPTPASSPAGRSAPGPKPSPAPSSQPSTGVTWCPIIPGYAYYPSRTVASSYEISCMEVVCNDPWVMDPATALGLAQQCRNMTGPACGSFVVFMDSTIMKRRVCYSSYTHGDMLESGVMLTKQPATWAAAVPCQGTYLALE